MKLSSPINEGFDKRGANYMERVSAVVALSIIVQAVREMPWV